ncbi:MAG TPA: quinolinate synthase NadA [Thermoanaerobaculia bacterium]|nr:quinolinate synthase NadA [Thermoanaerobaculia bacterium]
MSPQQTLPAFAALDRTLAALDHTPEAAFDHTPRAALDYGPAAALDRTPAALDHGPGAGYTPGAALDYTPEVARFTAAVAERVRAVIPPLEWPLHAPYVAAIAEWKARRNAVVLAHNYQTPEIYHGVADFTGDSLALAQYGATTAAEVIVLAGVHFMAETAKILSPGKTVLIPDPRAGCSLAAAISAADVRLLRQRYPGVPVVTNVNTSAAVKAESDICCTSANAVAVVESLGVPRVIFLPDEYLGRYVAEQTAVEVILWRGHCEVHERFTAAELRDFRAGHPGIHILAHPECPPEVLAEADFVGSTAAMIRHVGDTNPRRVVMVTECSMSDNVAVEFPDVEFIRPCALCPHMKRITLPKILRSLQAMEHRVEVTPEIADRARVALERMLAVGRRERRERQEASR